jgi:hypothetical protein
VICVIGLVGQDIGRRQALDQSPSLGDVVALATGEDEADGIAEGVDGDVQLGGQAAA